MDDFTHAATAYILRWNKPDYNLIIGVFLTQNDLDKFLLEHFSPSEIADTYCQNQPLKIEQGKLYRRKY